MKKAIIPIICIFTLYMNASAQSKFTFGLKGGAQYVDPKLYEFFDPFPYYKNKLSDETAPPPKIFGTTFYFLGYSVGAFVNYNLLKNGRIKLNSELNLNTRGYIQRNNDFKEFKITNTYLDIPLNIKIQPFYKAGVFVETGIYQAFILSNKTSFPSTNANSSEFEKRRSRANTREVNLFGFNVGAGYEFKKFDVSANYLTDKQYSYIKLGARFKLNRFF